MSVIARFEVIPVGEGSMSTAIAQALRALDRHPVSYQTTATDTIIEADSVDEVFAAVRDAHRAIREDRVITSIEVDEDRRRPQNIAERVAAVERELGHPPQRHEPTPPGAQLPQVAAQPPQSVPQHPTRQHPVPLDEPLPPQQPPEQHPQVQPQTTPGPEVPPQNQPTEMR